jgi:hypothetical protein
VTQDGGGHRRTADVAHADEDDVHR